MREPNKKDKKEEKKLEFSIPTIKSQTITVQNALNSPICTTNGQVPSVPGACDLYGS